MNYKHNYCAAVRRETLSRRRLEIRSNPWPRGYLSKEEMGDTQEAVRTGVRKFPVKARWGRPRAESWRSPGSSRGGGGLQGRDSRWYKAWGQIKSCEVFVRELYFQDDGVKSSLEFSAPGWPALFLSSGYCHSAGPEEAQEADLSLMSRLEEKGSSFQIEISIQITGHVYHLGQTATMVFIALSRPSVLQEESSSHPLKN